MELDPEVISACQQYAEMNGSSFEISHDFMGAAEGAHVLYPKAWAATPILQPPVGEYDMDKTQEIFDRYKDWKATREYMELGDKNAIYMHCLPADITGVSCEEGEVVEAVFERYRVPLYKEASFKPYIIAAMMFLSKVQDPAEMLSRIHKREKSRIYI